MFCINCGAQLASEAKFCQGCGTAIPNSPSLEGDSKKGSVEISPAEILDQSPTLLTAFENETWIIDRFKKKSLILDPEGLNQKVVGRFRGGLGLPDGYKTDLVFTDKVLGLLCKGSAIKWPNIPFTRILEKHEIKLIQVGTANHVHTSGAASTSKDFWTIGIILQDDKELPLLYIPLGDSNYKMQKTAEMYSAKISVLGQFWPVSLDGGHIAKSSGYSISVGAGFWHAID